MHEVAFYHAFGRDLQAASEWLYKYNTTPDAPTAYLNQVSHQGGVSWSEDSFIFNA